MPAFVIGNIAQCLEKEKVKNAQKPKTDIYGDFSSEAANDCYKSFLRQDLITRYMLSTLPTLIQNIRLAMSLAT